MLFGSSRSSWGPTLHFWDHEGGPLGPHVSVVTLFWIIKNVRWGPWRYAFWIIIKEVSWGLVGPRVSDITFFDHQGAQLGPCISDVIRLLDHHQGGQLGVRPDQIGPDQITKSAHKKGRIIVYPFCLLHSWHWVCFLAYKHIPLRHGICPKLYTPKIFG